MKYLKPMFIRVLHADFLKYRKSLLAWITLAYPFFTSALVFVVHYGMKDMPEDPVFFFSRALLLSASFFLPFFLILLITQANFIENRMEGWKLLYVQPIPKWAYFVSKILLLILSCFLAYLLLYVFSLVCMKVLNWHYPEPIFGHVFQGLRPAFARILEVYASASLMMAIQYYLSVRLKNFIVPLGIGIAATILPIAVFITLGIAGIIKSQQALTRVLRFDPYTLPFSFVFDFEALSNEKYLGHTPPAFIAGSVVLSLVVLIAACIDQSRRDIT